MGDMLSEIEHAASARQVTAANAAPILRGSSRHLACINKLSLDTTAEIRRDRPPVRAYLITVHADDRPLPDSPAGFVES